MRARLDRLPTLLLALCAATAVLRAGVASAQPTTIDFDDVPAGIHLSDEYAARGVVFPGGSSVLVSNNTFNAITIPSPPNYVRIDLIQTITFVSTANPQIPATTGSVSFTNPAGSTLATFNGIFAEALDLSGAVVATATVPPMPNGQGRTASTTTLTAPGIHQLRLTSLPAPVSQGVAPFDDLVIGPLTAVTPAPTVTIAATTPATAEGGAPGTLTLTRTGTTTLPLTVTLVTAGTATSGADFAALPASATIPAGSSTAMVTVTPIDDAVVEATETVIVTAVAGGAYVVSAPGSVTVTIADNDVATVPTVSIVASAPTATEGGPDGSVTVSRTGTTSQPLTVSLSTSGAVAGVDVTPLPTSVTIPAGDSSAVVAVTAIDDLRQQAALPLVVTVVTSGAYTVGASASATVMILDNDPLVAPPTLLEVVQVAGLRVTLRWDPPLGGEPPEGYVLEGGVAPGQTLATIDLPAEPPVFSFDAPPGAFFIRMRSKYQSQTSTSSNEVPLVVSTSLGPSAPAALTGFANGTVLGLSWKRTFQGGVPTGYIVDISGAATASVPVTGPESFAFAGVPPGVYTFTVRAANAAGAGPASTPVTLAFPASVCSGAPSTPARFLAYGAGSRLGLVWDPPSTGSAPSGYVVRVTGPITGDYPVGMSRVFEVPVPPGAYTFSVLATNACGASSPTAARSVIIP